jgi:hypothetical protein
MKLEEILIIKVNKKNQQVQKEVIKKDFSMMLIDLIKVEKNQIINKLEVTI